MKKSLISSHSAYHRPRDKLVTYYHNRFPLISFSEKMTAGISADGHCMLFPESCQDFAKLICCASCRDRPP